MNRISENDSLSKDRMESFVDSDNESMITGKRRMGQNRLMDDIYNILKNKHSENPILVVEENDDIHETIKDGLCEDSIVLIYYVSKTPGWEDTIRKHSKGKTTVYCGQELCHQVPICFKKIINGVV